MNPRILVWLGALLCAAGLSTRAEEAYSRVVSASTTDGYADDVALQHADADLDGSVFVASVIRGPANFATGISIPAKTTGTPSLEPYDVVLSKLGGKGTWAWAKRVLVPLTFASADFNGPAITTPLRSLAVRDIKIGPTNVFVVGNLVGADTVGREVGFISKLDKSGNVVWTRYLSSIDTTGQISINAVAEGPDGSVYFGGRVNGRTSIYWSSATRLERLDLVASTPSNVDSYLAKLDASGNRVWVMSSTGGGDEETVALETDGLGDVHVVINLRNSGASLRNANGTTTSFSNLKPPGKANRGLFAGKVSSSGSWSVGRSFGGLGDLSGVTGGTAILEGVTGTDLKLIAGKVVLAGSYSAGAKEQGFIARLTAENYSNDGSVAYLQAAVGGASYPTRIRSSGNGLFVVGKRPRTLRVYGDVDPAATDIGEYDQELVALQDGEFVGSFDLNLQPQWLRATARPELIPTPRNLLAGLLAFDGASRRVYWGGSFATPETTSLTVGEFPNETPLRTATTPNEKVSTWGWLTAFGADGHSVQQVRLTVLSRIPGYVVNGQTITTTNYSEAFLQGTAPTIQANDLENNGTRHVFDGYALDNASGNTLARTFEIPLLADTTVTMNWSTEHQLYIDSDHGSVGLNLAALAGNPSPIYGSSWVRDGDPIDVTVDGIIPASDPTQVGSRYVLASYTLTDLPAPYAVGPTAGRIQVSQLKANGFKMKKPMSLLYSWKRQNKVTVQVSNPDAGALVVTRQSPVTTNSPSYTGPGELWFDHNATIEVLARSVNTDATLTLKGWDFAAPVTAFFPTTTFLPNDPNYPLDRQLQTAGYLTTTSLTAGGPTYYQRRLVGLKQGASIIWNYGDPTYATNVAVGVPFSFPAIAGKGSPPTTGWANLRLLDAPPGSVATDMLLWDPRNKLAIPTRPGIFLLDLDYGIAPNQKRVVLQVYSGFAGDPFQNDPAKTNKYTNPKGVRKHIANTPPVLLDRLPDDAYFFKELRYSTGDGTVKNGRFEATVTGKSVLVYTSRPASAPANLLLTGDLNAEDVNVAVVDTTLWSASLVSIFDPVPIGTRLTSPQYDKANLGTGYVIHKIANYNPEIYDRSIPAGPIIPINAVPSQAVTDVNVDRRLAVAWYEEGFGAHWPSTVVMYWAFAWPTPASNRIVIASRLGSEGLNGAGNRQLVFDPELYDNVRIYQQPDPDQPGYNPNEEHARLYPSLHASLGGKVVPAAFALRNDLNLSTNLIQASGGRLTITNYTSDPYVLVQYVEKATQEPKMAVYAVVRDDPAVHDPWAAELPGASGDTYRFAYSIRAGERLNAPYPLNLAMGVAPCINGVPTDTLFSSASAIPDGSYFLDIAGQPRVWFVDHQGGTWAAGGDSSIRSYFMYPLAPDFWYPLAQDDSTLTVQGEGDCVPWLPKYNLAAGQQGVFDPDAADLRVRTEPLEVLYTTTWPTNAPVLKVGETLTFSGGEYKADHPDAEGLPGVVGFAAAEVVFDSKNPFQRTAASESVNYLNSYSARIIAPLEERRLALPASALPANLNSPASADITVEGDTWFFNKLTPSLQKRVFYRPLAKLTSTNAPGVLVLRGFVNDRTLGAADLTAAPDPVYVLEPNILTSPEVQELATGITTDGNRWSSYLQQLATLSRNPADLDNGGGNGWKVGLERLDNNRANAKPLAALGPGLALVPNPRLLDPSYSFGAGKSGYVTVAENNHPRLGDAPITLHVIRIDPAQRYRGAIKTILPANVFDEKITLRHTADFGGNVDQVVYAWWYREEDGQAKAGHVPPGQPGVTPVWQALDASVVPGRVSINLAGNPTLLLADQRFFVRYRYNTTSFTETDWSSWAGAANSTPQDLDQDGRPDYRGQLAMGWVKRVLDAVNPYEARLREFGRNNSPATAASMIRQLGTPYFGPVALNASKDVVENLGLIELYETVLQRARDMTVSGTAGISSSGINAAILLASTRLAEFYTLLANEAWDDALDPTLGYGRGVADPANLNTARFCFENQQPDLLNEELALLRGVDESYGRPVFNRLFWNFTKGEGEVAYALNYQIADVNNDGFIDEKDAQIQYPMGHGDAWGHYLSAMRKRYDLLRLPLFDWENRTEYYNLLDVAIQVDYQDERSFARTAAARARVGSEIVNLTFRSRYSESPDSKLSGYTDADKDRAWGVTEWARRAGQAAFFDWVTANSLLPSTDPDPGHAGLQVIDRQSVTEIGEVATQLAVVQTTLDGANSGLNAIGLDPDVMAFDIDPTFIDVGSTAQIGTKAVQGLTHYEQIFERALEAMKNADRSFALANEQKAKTRALETSAQELRRRALAQDLEYRNRLIEIFGTPYEGQIGAGQAYPAGYAGPDLNLFMYVDVNAITPETVPVADDVTYFDEYVSFHALDQDIPEEFRADIQEHFLDDISVAGNTAVELLGDDRVHLQLPATAADYTFVAPAGWGQRAAPGRLQTLVGEMLQVQADLSLAVGDYDYLIKQARDRVALLKMRADIDATIIGIREDAYHRTLGLEAAINALEGVQIVAGRTADYIEIIGEAAAELPVAVGTTVDPTAPARQAVKFGASAGWLASSIIAGAAEGSINALGSFKELVDLRDELDIDEKEMTVELRGMLHDIEELLVNEGVIRIRLFSIREQLRGLLDQYRATLQEGIRIIEERRNANTQLAADTQSNRYHDQLFRSSRHESIQRYRSLFDLAQRYGYLAAKAYDFETNFDPRDRASAQPFLTDIVRARSLGLLTEVAPVAGPGLAGILARMQDNFRAIEGRLGFNNLQLDSTTFSLRAELARIPKDATADLDWQDYLDLARVDDLWGNADFRRYCRPFTAQVAGQPGLVIQLHTGIRTGKNFFGQPLAAGDSTYDPTMYATKIRGAGIRFVGYPVDRLARTPYVYLIPAGLDIMTIPNSRALKTREWKVVDQAIPAPYATSALDLSRELWLPYLDTLGGTLGEIRRFSAFRAGVIESDPDVNVTRFVGRSVWNDNWILFIPGQSLHELPQVGIQEFIANVKDIQLTFETYGYSGN